MIASIDKVNHSDAEQVVLQEVILLRPMAIHRTANLVLDLHKSNLAADTALIQQERTRCR